MVKPLEERVLEERMKMKVKKEDLLKRIENEARGEKSKRILKQILETESLGVLHWAILLAPVVVAEGKGSTIRDAFLNIKTLIISLSPYRS